VTLSSIRALDKVINSGGVHITIQWHDEKASSGDLDAMT
jgi:hypothetical protein